MNQDCYIFENWTKYYVKHHLFAFHLLGYFLLLKIICTFEHNIALWDSLVRLFLFDLSQIFGLVLSLLWCLANICIDGYAFSQIYMTFLVYHFFLYKLIRIWNLHKHFKPIIICLTSEKFADQQNSGVQWLFCEQYSFRLVDTTWPQWLESAKYKRFRNLLKMVQER